MAKLTRVWNKGLVIVVGQIAEWSIAGEGVDALLRQDAHVDLQAQQGEDGQREQRQDDDVTQILHRLDHSSHDGLQSWFVPHIPNIFSKLIISFLHDFIDFHSVGLFQIEMIIADIKLYYK